eukprot:scaffold638_cov382-Prasinococcus_capsulatus_cf.AAC.3
MAQSPRQLCVSLARPVATSALESFCPRLSAGLWTYANSLVQQRRYHHSSTQVDSPLQPGQETHLRVVVVRDQVDVRGKVRLPEQRRGGRLQGAVGECQSHVPVGLHCHITTPTWRRRVVAAAVGAVAHTLAGSAIRGVAVTYRQRLCVFHPVASWAARNPHDSAAAPPQLGENHPLCHGLREAPSYLPHTPSPGLPKCSHMSWMVSAGRPQAE